MARGGCHCLKLQPRRDLRGRRQCLPESGGFQAKPEGHGCRAGAAGRRKPQRPLLLNFQAGAQGETLILTSPQPLPGALGTPSPPCTLDSPARPLPTPLPAASPGWPASGGQSNDTDRAPEVQPTGKPLPQPQPQPPWPVPVGGQAGCWGVLCPLGEGRSLHPVGCRGKEALASVASGKGLGDTGTGARRSGGRAQRPPSLQCASVALLRTQVWTRWAAGWGR